MNVQEDRPGNSDRETQLQAIAEEVENLQESPLYSYRKKHGYRVVPGEGTVDARIVLVGEAPGAQEAATGKPFAGRAGSLLEALLESIGIQRDEAFITNVVKDRPPGNRVPNRDEIEVYGPFLIRQVNIIQPAVIATLGRIAMDFFLKYYNLEQKNRKIGELHGKILEAQADFGVVKIVPLYHPAAAFYRQDLQNTMQQDIKVLIDEGMWKQKKKSSS